jgi:hypothetical protein
VAVAVRPDDQAGALNEITPEVVRQAVTLVRHGPVYDLAHVLHQDVSAFPCRTFRQYLTTNYHRINRRGPGAGPESLGRNNVNWIVEQGAGADLRVPQDAQLAGRDRGAHQPAQARLWAAAHAASPAGRRPHLGRAWDLCLHLQRITVVAG